MTLRLVLQLSLMLTFAMGSGQVLGQIKIKNNAMSDSLKKGAAPVCMQKHNSRKLVAGRML